MNSIFGMNVVESIREETRQRMDVGYVFQTCRRLESLINQQAIEVTNLQRRLIALEQKQEKETVGDVISRAFNGFDIYLGGSEVKVYWFDTSTAHLVMTVPVEVWKTEMEKIRSEKR